MVDLLFCGSHRGDARCVMRLPTTGDGQITRSKVYDYNDSFVVSLFLFEGQKNRSLSPLQPSWLSLSLPPLAF
jgi:hypothetical protein